MAAIQGVFRRGLAAVAAASIAAPVVVMALAVPARAAEVPLYPDLRTEPPRELRFDRADVTADLTGDFHNVLRFSNDTYNAGEGPLLLNATIDPTTRSGPSTQRVMNSDGTFTDYALHNDIYWHEAHHHYHFDHWGEYQLWTQAGYAAWIASGRTSGSPLYTGAKTTSCVTDEEFITSAPNAVYPGPYGLGGCDSGSNWQIHMGLSVGWGDTYDWYRQDQWIDLGQSTLGDGTYVLRSVADPLNIVYESAGKADSSRESVADNEAQTTFIVRGGNIVDSDAPTGTVTINNVDKTTSTPNVQVAVIGRDDVSEPSQFSLSNDGTHWATFTYTTSGSEPTTTAWNLADPTTGGTADSGTRTVYARVRDNSGKWGPTFTDTIDYESGAPPPPSGAYADLVEADQPAGYWRLDERTGTTAHDAVGGNPGTYRGGVQLGRPSLLMRDNDYASSFSGAGQSVGIPSSAPLSPAATVSVEAWINPVSMPPAGTFASIVTKPESYALQLDGSQLEFLVMEGGARHRVTWSKPLALDQPYHVVGTYDGAVGRLYVNGQLVVAVGFNDSITTNTNLLNIGSWDGTSEFFHGVIDEAAVYPRVLGAAQIARHYEAGSGPTKPVQSTLVISKSGSGGGEVLSSPSGISCGSRCAASFVRGTQVTVVARPASDAKFAGWSGGPCHGTGACTFALRGNTTVNARFLPLATYPRVVAGDHPAGYWRLDDASGMTAADTAGSSPGIYAGAKHGAPGLIALRPDAAAGFSGRRQFIGAGSNPGLAAPRHVSVEAWVRPAALPARGKVVAIVAKPESYALQIVGHRLQFAIIQHGVRHRVRAPARAIAVGRTSHVVGTYDGSVLRLFVNGALVVAGNCTGPIDANSRSLFIGSWSGSSQFFRGIIDEVAVYRSPLSADHVHIHASRGHTVMSAAPHATTNAGTRTLTSAAAPVAVDAAIGRVYRPCPMPAACVEVVDADSRAVIARVPVEHSWRPVGVAVDPHTHLVYAASAVFDPDAVRGVVTVIDGSTATAVATIPVGRGPQAIAVDATTGRVYVTEQAGLDGGAAVAVIDGATRRVVATVPIGRYARYYDNPDGLAVDAATHTVYASNALEGVVYVVDGMVGEIRQSITTGDAPTAISVDATTGAVSVETARGVVLLDR